MSVSPAAVRSALTAQGIEVPAKGRLSAEHVAAFNKGKRGAARYTPGAYLPTVTVKAKPAKGRTVTRAVNVAEVRKALAAQGIEVGARGPLSPALLAQHVLGTAGE